jgi:hypothetical protein
MKHTVKTIQAMRDNDETITMLTASDYPAAKKVNDAGMDSGVHLYGCVTPPTQPCRCFKIDTRFQTANDHCRLY